MTLRLVKENEKAADRAQENAYRPEAIRPGERFQVLYRGTPVASTEEEAKRLGLSVAVFTLDEFARPMQSQDGEEVVVEVDVAVRFRVHVGRTPRDSYVTVERMDVQDMLEIPKAVVALQG